MSDYTEADLIAALRDAGVADGDLLFVQADLDRLGIADSCPSSDARSAMVLRALQHVVGARGTVIVPTYTFSFCQQQPFDIAHTPTAAGPWSPSCDFLEYVRQQPDTRRSPDPMHSVAVLGPHASRLLDSLACTCFGIDSICDRLRQHGAKICLIGVGPHEASLVHHAEVMSRVPYRFNKLFTGQVIEQGAACAAGWIYEVRWPVPNTEPDEAGAACEGWGSDGLRRVNVGHGLLHVADAQTWYARLADRLAGDPWCVVRGPALSTNGAAANGIGTKDAAADGAGTDRAAALAASPAFAAARALAPDASMEAIIHALWRLPRDIVSDGYDAALDALRTLVPMQIHGYPTGTPCFTWIVPEHWTCHEAWLESLDGRRLFSYADHPLHVVSYSLPFEGIVSRDELFAHLHVHARLPDAVPFVFKYYERDWGLCCSRRLRDSLHDSHYRVAIRTTFRPGVLKVGEVVVPGRTDEDVVLCAHLCHPHMAVDDLTGVAVGVDVMRALLSRGTHPYTYRLLIVPETIGTVAYLSDHASRIPHMKGGLFLEMLGLDHPHALQRSLAGETAVDACFVAALQRHDPHGWTAPYRMLPGNDERQFNAPGVRVPMLSLMRVLPPSSPDHPYREYHSSDDTPAIVSPARLADSRDLVLRMIDALEADRVPINRFAGEICCSRFGLHVDWTTSPDAHRSRFAIMDLVDGTRSVAQIAAAAHVSEADVLVVLDMLQQHGLVSLP